MKYTLHNKEKNSMVIAFTTKYLPTDVKYQCIMSN